MNCKKLKCIALTIDDGPVPGTSRVLDVLKKKGVSATFFMLGQSVNAYPKIVKRMADEGHAIGNHSFSHPQFLKLSKADMDSQLSRTQKAIKKAGGKTPVLFRPPYGQLSASIKKAAKDANLSIILWTIDPQDWKDKDTDTVVKRITKSAKRNAVVLIHDVWPTTRAAIEPVIDKLLSQ
ncbi:MAG: polysaccharide deacetylase family protein, partial [Propionibacteriaceae bacterium]|nr:polysaccharide deacetylase family protein [Propionibacteriaceae bacterium]